jgi:hypothetical protein
MGSLIAFLGGRVERVNRRVTSVSKRPSKTAILGSH